MSVTTELMGVMRLMSPTRTFPAGEITLAEEIALTISSGAI
jgi:hypothetical protein